jgi:hypothetical protein
LLPRAKEGLELFGLRVSVGGVEEIKVDGAGAGVGGCGKER